MDRRQEVTRRQLRIDYTRAEQLGMIRAAMLPRLEIREGNTTTRVSSDLAKHILRVIDDHGGGREAWISIETIARELGGKSVRQVKRALRALAQHSLLCVTRRRTPSGATCNHYVIVWTELDLLGRSQHSADQSGFVDHGEPGVQAPGDPADRTPDLAPDQSAITTDQSAITTDQSAASGTRSAPKRPRSAPPPPPSVSSCSSNSSPRPEWADERGWEEVEEIYRGRIGVIRELIQEFAGRGRSPGELIAEIDTALATVALVENATRVRDGASAAVWFVRTGSWPVPGIVPLAEVERRHRAAQLAAEAALREAEARTARDQQIVLEREQREAQHGARLDAMSTADREALAARIAEEGRRVMAARSLRSGTWQQHGSLGRELLLAQLQLTPGPSVLTPRP